MPNGMVPCQLYVHCEGVNAEKITRRTAKARRCKFLKYLNHFEVYLKVSNNIYQHVKITTNIKQGAWFLHVFDH